MLPPWERLRRIDAASPRTENNGMMNAEMRTLPGALLLMSIASISLPAQWLNQPTAGIPRTPDGKPNLSAPAPRTPDGKPDLSGLWNKVSPKYSRNIAADLKPDEIQPWAQALVDRRREDLGR